MLFIGPEAERRFGHRHFMNLMAVFTAPPEFTVLHGRDEIGRTDPSLLADRVEGPRLLLLGGRNWRVTWTDWKRRRCFVEPAESGGRARWPSDGVGGLSYEIARSMRDVLLGADVPVAITQRAAGILAAHCLLDASAGVEFNPAATLSTPPARWHQSPLGAAPGGVLLCPALGLYQPLRVNVVPRSTALMIAAV
jgi:hypothetical protein